MALPWGSRTPGFKVTKTRAFMVSPVACECGAPMASLRGADKFYDLFTLSEHFFRPDPRKQVRWERDPMVVGIAIAMFIALFGWGAGYFGWDDPHGKIQLALATSFILGIIGGYK